VPISYRHVEEALRALGGEAQIGEILSKVLEIAPRPHPRRAREVVRGRLYQFSSETSSYKTGTPDLFQSVDGLAANTGRWRLKAYHAAEEIEDIVLEDTEVEMEAAEGRRRLRVHLARERSRSLIKAFKAQLSSYECEACGADMGDVYGLLGEGYIEAHHRIPVSSLKDGETTKLRDLAALCPNCHRMIHRNDLMSVEDLAAHMRARHPRLGIAAEPGQAEWRHDPPDQGD